jgi:hypothetical protein
MIIILGWFNRDDQFIPGAELFRSEMAKLL